MTNNLRSLSERSLPLLLRSKRFQDSSNLWQCTCSSIQTNIESSSNLWLALANLSCLVSWLVTYTYIVKAKWWLLFPTKCLLPFRNKNMLLGQTKLEMLYFKNKLVLTIALTMTSLLGIFLSMPYSWLTRLIRSSLLTRLNLSTGSLFQQSSFLTNTRLSVWLLPSEVTKGKPSSLLSSKILWFSKL